MSTDEGLLMTDSQSIPPPGPDADRQRRARADAKQLLERRRRRIRIIRKRAITGSLAAFAGAWAVMCFQLVSGNDPALSKNGKAAATQGAKATKSSGTASSSGSSQEGSTSTGSTQSSSPPASSQPLAPVTTQQS
jgi:hypothetical protein